LVSTTHDPRLHRVSQDLAGPASVVEILVKRLRLDEEDGLPLQHEGIVDRPVAWPEPVLEVHFVEIFEIPAERSKDGHDQRRLGVLLTDARASVAIDPLRDFGERLPKSVRSRVRSHGLELRYRAYSRQAE
jgi:hypothetical protein